MFQFSDKHIEDFRALGYTVFRGILPPSLIGDLRRECEKGAAQARAQMGSPQRFQPVSAYQLDIRPFEDYRDLPALCDAIHRVLSPRHSHGDFDVMGVLLEPTEQPSCTQWHRDWRDNVKAADLDRWEADYRDENLFNQINCALYEDSCTWVVPGSHLRRDTPEEIAVFPERPILGPNVQAKSGEERERLCLDYCEQMPGAERLLLNAGDFCLYRNTLWHLGNYIPYRKRATLHDGAMTPEFRQWTSENIAEVQRRIQAGAQWENPNRRVAATA